MARTADCVSKIMWAWQVNELADKPPLYFEVDNQNIIRFIHRTRNLDFKKFLEKYEGLSPRRSPNKRSRGKVEFYGYVNKLLMPGLMDEGKDMTGKQSS